MPSEEEKISQDGPSRAAAGESSRQMPPAEFSGFVVSMAQAAMIQLGEFPDPVTGVKSINLPQARYSIDILDMLAQKTAGNLTSEEKMLIDKILDDLRLLYVRVSKR